MNAVDWILIALMILLLLRAVIQVGRRPREVLRILVTPFLFIGVAFPAYAIIATARLLGPSITVSPHNFTTSLRVGFFCLALSFFLLIGDLVRRAVQGTGTPPGTAGRMTVLHLALTADWDAARATGEYRVSTRGRTLEEEGFIHACADHAQLDGVARRYYRGVTDPLTLLTIDPTGLDVRFEAPPGPRDDRHIRDGAETFPHIYGPVPVSAVVSAEPFTLPP
ncbi:DUF952 domain-containing protein [Planobispora rosea]|nr:DUF952 domain-containing protein [Planobispora rosea]